jgi:Xaa-Pro aminopeptidase
MARLERELLEKTGAAFTDAGILSARKRSWEALHAIASRLRPGMTEEEGRELAQQMLRERGSAKIWHRPHVRFGKNTLLSYGSPSEPNVVLQEEDVFFLDLGPIFDGFEGDVGATFQVGSNPEHARIIRDGQAIFAEVKEKWRTEKLTGEALYDFARQITEPLGWKLTLEEANGHRLSDFPHAIYFKGGISELGFTPAAQKWVLEIQIRHPELPFGAFHEDLLVDEADSPFTK